MKQTPMYPKDEKQRHYFGVSKFIFLMTIILLTPSCASMFSKTLYPISISRTLCKTKDYLRVYILDI